jgi:hypothetical protein
VQPLEVAVGVLLNAGTALERERGHGEPVREKLRSELEEEARTVCRERSERSRRLRI